MKNDIRKIFCVWTFPAKPYNSIEINMPRRFNFGKGV